MEGEAKSNAVAAHVSTEAEHEGCSQSSRTNGSPATAPQAWATGRDVEGGLDEEQPRNCYRAKWKPTRENLDALFQEIDDMNAWLRSQPNLLLPDDDDDGHTSKVDALIQEVEAILALDRRAPGSGAPGSTQDVLGDSAHQAASTAAAVAEPSVAEPTVAQAGREKPVAQAGCETELAERLAFRPPARGLAAGEADAEKLVDGR